jgi:hypothetical protein
MKTLNQEQIQLIYSALLHYAAEQENIISQYYLEPDHEENVAESVKIVDQLGHIMRLFYDKENIHIMNTKDKQTLDEAFDRSETIYTSEDNYVLKSGMFIGLIDGIKAVVQGKY